MSTPQNPIERSPAPPVLEETAIALIHLRQTILPKRLAAPGPSPEQLRRILAAAAAAPDHGELLPWRFVQVSEAARASLADAFETALIERDPAVLAAQREQAREKAFRAPLLLLAIARLDPQAEIPEVERLVSAGCAIQNMLLVATAQGFGSALTSGKAMQSQTLRALFRLEPHEQALCFISIGTPQRAKAQRVRPEVERYFSVL
ncbi:MAG TPA: nitroreductase [Ramlibacter sp.]|nr:nitroreductase [Ramlibacter sp.]